MIDKTISANLELARAISLSFRHYTDGVWASTEALGSAVFLHGEPLPPEDVRRLMREHSGSHPTVLGFALLDPDGHLVLQDMSRTDQQYFQRILRGEDRVISDLFPGTETGTPTIAMITAVRREDRLLGAVLAPLYLEALDEVFHFKGSPERLVGLIDRNGRLVYIDPPMDLSFEQRQVSQDNPLLPVLDGEHVSLRHFVPESGGMALMGAAVPIPDIGWGAFVATPVDGPVAAARRSIMETLLLTLVALSISIVGIIVIVRGVLSRFHSLQETASSWAEARFDVRAPVREQDELAATAQSFNDMADRLQRLEDEHRRFIDVIAHELTNPAATAKSRLQLMQHNIRRGRNLDDLPNRLHEVEGQIDIMSRLFSDLTKAFGEGSGGLSIEPRKIDLCAFLQSVVEDHQSQADHVIILSTPKEPVTVNADPQRLRQVMDNTIGNAIKYSPAGEEVRITLREEGERALVSVQDHGIGIPEHEAEHIFQGFYRGQNALQFPGTGLGLYISQGIIQRHGGRIWAQSVPLKGTTMYIELPIYRQSVGRISYTHDQQRNVTATLS